jgi:hypothetical protein
MTGAGGIIHANFMYQQGKPDGLIIGNNAGGLFLQQLMAAKGGSNLTGKNSSSSECRAPIIQHAPLPR